MIDYPKTVKEAEEYKYGEWAGWTTSIAYLKGQCAYEVGSVPTRQCSRGNGHGPANLYCKQHAKIIGED